MTPQLLQWVSEGSLRRPVTQEPRGPRARGTREVGGKPASLDQFLEMQLAASGGGGSSSKVVSATLAPFSGEAAPPPPILTSGKEAEAGVGIACASSSAPASCLLQGTQRKP